MDQAPTPDLKTWLAGLRNGPTVFPHQLDAVNRRLLLVKLTEAKIRNASFLDQRVLDGKESGGWIPLADAIEATPINAGPAGIILHCGHCGSTLVSRLLGELSGAWVLREPLALRALAAEARAAGSPLARLTAEEFHQTLALVQGAYGRLPAGATHAIVKHTSLTANLGVALAAQSSPPAVLCLSIPLEDYLATMLRGPGPREGVRLTAGEWIQDLAVALGSDCPALADLDDAELAALNWTAAQLAFAHTRSVDNARVLNFQFDDFLADPESRLGELAAHFGFETNDAALAQVLSSRWLRCYAKDPRYPFDAATRRRELTAAMRNHAAAIRRGLDFGNTLCARILTVRPGLSGKIKLP